MTQGSCLGACVAILALASTANGATLTVTGGGLLAGATGVNVGGTLYDVEFVDGSCIALFDGCDAITDFEFTTESAAVAASQALLDQVFLNVPQGTFDDTPFLTVGCPGGDGDPDELNGYRVLQRAAPRRVLERAPVHVDRRCQDEDRSVAGRLQSAPATQLARASDTERVRHDTSELTGR